MIKLRPVSILVAIGSICLLKQRRLVEAVSELDNLTKGYKEINHHLIDEGTIKSNVDAAIKWINSQSNLSEHLQVALESLTALKSDAIYKCNHESHAILLKNEQATEYRTHVQKLKFQADRIDKVVHHYALDHAKVCQEIYPKAFESIYEQMDYRKWQLVERYLNELIGAHLFFLDPDMPIFNGVEPYFFEPEQRSLFIENVMNIDTVTGFGDADIAFRAIESTDRNIRKLMARRLDRVVGIVRTLFVDPCQYYMSKLGPDVFVPAEYDNEILEESERFQPFNQQMGKFYLGWAHFRLCKLLVESQRDLVQHVMGIAQQYA